MQAQRQQGQRIAGAMHWGRVLARHRPAQGGAHMNAVPLKARVLKQCRLRSRNRMDVKANVHSKSPIGT